MGDQLDYGLDGCACTGHREARRCLAQAQAGEQGGGNGQPDHVEEHFGPGWVPAGVHRAHHVQPGETWVRDWAVQAPWLYRDVSIATSLYNCVQHVCLGSDI